MQAVIASSNQGKIIELKQLLPKIDWISQAELNIASVPETGLSFVENAILKARNAAKQSKLPALADDSGIIIDALDGRPGLYSARYAGSHDFKKNIAKVLSEMQGMSNRAARFYCALVMVNSADDTCPIIATGAWEGLILEQPRGENGFGYDPIFLDPDLKLSAAEIDLATKDKISHRAQAIKQLLTEIHY